MLGMYGHGDFRLLVYLLICF